MSEPETQNPERAGLVYFSCGNCGRRLSVSSELGSVSGPCPACGAMIRATDSLPEIHFDVLPNSRPGVTHPQAVKRSGKSVPGRGRGHIPADSMLDHRHLDQKETTKTLFVIMMFILAICACLAVSWFFDTWLAK